MQKMCNLKLIWIHLLVWCVKNQQKLLFWRKKWIWEYLQLISFVVIYKLSRLLNFLLANMYKPNLITGTLIEKNPRNNLLHFWINIEAASFLRFVVLVNRQLAIVSLTVRTCSWHQIILPKLMDGSIIVWMDILLLWLDYDMSTLYQVETIWKFWSRLEQET